MRTLHDACSAICAANNQNYIYGRDLSREVASRIDDPARPLVLVTGLNWFRDSGHEERWLEDLPDPALAVRVPPDPSVDWVPVWLDRLEGLEKPLLVAIGGGSVLDAAKVLSAFTAATWTPEGRKVPVGQEIREWWAVPTTAGTGSEVTPYASFTGTDGRKFSFDDRCLLPRRIFHDGALLDGLPAGVVADCAADALSQALESLWAKGATSASREVAVLAVRAWSGQAVNSFQGDGKARAAMQAVALLAGAAIAVSRTTGVHAVSYPMTARFGIPHGRALACLLPDMMQLAGPHLDNDVDRLICGALEVSGWEQVVDRVRKSLRQLDLPVTPVDIGFDADQIDTILAEGFRPDRMGNHPHVPDPEELRSLLAGDTGR